MRPETPEKVKPTKGFPLWREVGGVALCVLGLLLLLSLATYSPADPSLNHLTVSGELSNAAGRAGALAADLLVQALGWGAALFPLAALLLGVFSFLPATREGWATRLAGAFLFVLSSALLLELVLGKGTVFGVAEREAGGVLGYLLLTGLTSLLARPGAALLGMGLLAVAFLFLTHVSLLTAGRTVLGWAQAFALNLVKMRERNRRHKAVEREKQELEEEEAPGPASRPERPRKPPRPKAPPPEPEQEEFPTISRPRGRFRLPPLSLLEDGDARAGSLSDEELSANARLLEKKLRDYGVRGRITDHHTGPAVTLYEYEPDPGVKVMQIASRADDLGVAMGGVLVRIVERIPGKAAIGIEVPNKTRQKVTLREVLKTGRFREGRGTLRLALGKDTGGESFVTDLDSMPHLLVAGSTGMGKSVCVNSIILSLLYNLSPEEVKFLMVDPKMVELSHYEGIPHLLSPVVVDPKKAAMALRWVVREMERRYQLMHKHQVKDIDRYNKRDRKRQLPPGPGGIPVDTEEDDDTLPRIVVVIDELADLMMVSSREVEECIMRLGQMARAAGIHLILATQRPTVDIVSGNVKNNITGRIAFKVSTRGDSRVVLDGNGAEALLGKGDMLFAQTSLPTPVRIQGAYVSEDEVEKTAAFLRGQAAPEYREDIFVPAAGDEGGEGAEGDEVDDEKFGEVLSFAYEKGFVSASMIQRRFKVGYNRAARMVERMEEEGIIGAPDGAKPRQVLRRRD